MVEAKYQQIKDTTKFLEMRGNSQMREVEKQLFGRFNPLLSSCLTYLYTNCVWHVAGT